MSNQSNQSQTGAARAANASEAAAGVSEQLYISPATVADAVQALVPLATPTVPGIVTVTAAPFDTGAVATKTYADNLAIAGSPISEEAVNGIGQLATDAEAIAGTANNPGVTALFVTPSNLAPVFAAPPAAGFGSGTPRPVAATTLSASGAFSLTGDQVQVAEGGTGTTTLTDHGIMLGSGTSAVSVTAVGTNNQVLIGQSAADPIWSDNLDLPGTLDVTGTATFDGNVNVAGTVSLTGTFDIDNLAFSTNTISSTNTNGDINLTPDGTGDVVISSVDINAGAIDGVTLGTNSAVTEAQIDNININGNTIISTDTDGDINLTPDGTGAVVVSLLSLTTDLSVADGGTGASTLTDHGVLFGSGTSAITASAVGTNNQVLIGQSAADPIWSDNLDLPGALTLGTDLAVADGGTGASSLTDHGVLVGSGTGAVTPLSVGTNGQILVGSTGADPVFATAASANSSIAYTLGAGTLNLDVDESYLQTASVTIATGDVLTLATTPVELVAAPGAGKYIEFLSAQFILDYNSVAYTESGDNLGIKYTDASGVQVSSSVECTGFIDQSADTITSAIPVGDAIVAASGAVNQALVLDNLGSNFGAGNSPLIVKVSYRVITTGL